MRRGDNADKANCSELRDEGDGRATIILHGHLDAQTVSYCWRKLQKQLRGHHFKSLTVDATDAVIEGTIGIALIRYLTSKRIGNNAQVTLKGVDDATRALMDTFSPPEHVEQAHQPPLKIRIPEEVGSAVRSFVHDLYEQVAFVGAVVAALPAAIVNPRRMRWREVRRVFEKAGANALPVIALFSWLVGLVMALEGARPLRNLGAEIFIADIIGFSSFRSTGPLVTAIMLAGRSGSAFAAELGTMKVNEELDALTTMGLDPIRFLAVQRIVAAVLLTPLLTMYAILMAIFGGIVVMRFLGFPPLMIYHQIISRVGLNDFALGMEKAAIFGVIIGGVGCLRGLQTREGPRGVGAATTSSVVTSIMLIIVANTIFSTIIYFLKK